MVDTYVPGVTSYMRTNVAPAGTQGLPTNVASTQVPVDERSALLAEILNAPESLRKELEPLGLNQANLETFDTDTLRSLVNSQRGLLYSDATLAYNKANPNRVYATADPAAYYAAFGTVPVDFVGTSGYTDKQSGNLAAGEGTKYLTPVEGATYTLYSPKTGKVLGTASGPAGLAALAKQADDLNFSQGRKSDWQLYEQAPGADQPKLLGGNYYNSDRTLLGKITSAALPVVGAVAGGPLGAALGSAAAGALEGKSIGDIAKNAAISAGMTYLGGKVMPGGGAAPSTASGTGGAVSSLAKGATSAVQNALSKAAGEIVVNVPRIAGSAVGSALGAGASGALNAAVNAGGPRDPNQIVVTQSKVPTYSVPGAATGAATGALNNVGSKFNPDTNEIEVTQTKAPTTNTTGAATGAAASGALNSAASQQPATDEIVVKSKPLNNDVTTAGSATGAATGALNNVGSKFNPDTNEIEVTQSKAPTTNTTAGSAAGAAAGAAGTAGSGTAQQPATESTTSTLDKIKAGITLAGLIGDALSGGSKPVSGGTIPAGLNMSLSPTFSAELPAASLPGGPAIARAASALPQTSQDWYRYGYGPEQSFFTNVPQGAPNTSTAYTGYAHGGYAVGGPGDGRDDKIPAMLSDGEYVMDAETVAMLGNGSNKAGAQALDKMRVAVRKDKGRKLAKGNFSVKAKAPEKYLKGRN